MLWLFVGFILGWLIAGHLLVRKASTIAAVGLHFQVTKWHDILAASLGSGEADRKEKIKHVIGEMRTQLGG